MNLSILTFHEGIVLIPFTEVRTNFDWAYCWIGIIQPGRISTTDTPIVRVRYSDKFTKLYIETLCLHGTVAYLNEQ